MEEKDFNQETQAEQAAPEAEKAPEQQQAPAAESAPVTEAAAKVDAAIDGAVNKVFGSDDDGKKLSIAALILGIVGIAGGVFLSFIPFIGIITFVCALLGIILGVKGRGKSIAVNGKASGLATAGFILGIIGVVFGAVGLICSLCSSAVLCAGLGASNALAGLQ